MSIPFHQRQELARAHVARHPARQPVKRIEQQQIDSANATLDTFRERARRIVATLTDPRATDIALMVVCAIGWGVLLLETVLEAAGWTT